jgi:hypothetical protein
VAATRSSDEHERIIWLLKEVIDILNRQKDSDETSLQHLLGQQLTSLDRVAALSQNTVEMLKLLIVRLGDAQTPLPS